MPENGVKMLVTPPALPAYSSLVARVIMDVREIFSPNYETPLQSASYDQKLVFRHDITPVNDSNIYVGTSPNHSAMSRFIGDLAYNTSLSVPHVIGLSESLMSDNRIAESFTDFCSKNQPEAMLDSYKISVNNNKKLSDEIIQSRFMSKLNENDLENAAFYYQYINVTLIGLNHHNFIPLVNDASHLMKETLLRLAILQEPVVMYSPARKGYAAHLAFTFTLIRNFSNIFSGGNPAVIAEKIYNIFCRSHQSSHLLAMDVEQFVEAIRNADILHRYALRKGYQLENKKECLISTPSLMLDDAYFRPKQIGKAMMSNVEQKNPAASDQAASVDKNPAPMFS